MLINRSEVVPPLPNKLVVLGSIITKAELGDLSVNETAFTAAPRTFGPSALVSETLPLGLFKKFLTIKAGPPLPEAGLPTTPW